ncbi:MAG: hypothetical protein IJ861_07335 [Clostridia bacterium]|nr:hypothetical protein [Clostridia bacterium]
MTDKEKMIVTRNEGREDIKTAFICSCPGQEEEKSGRLVNGQTGKNLDMMLGILSAKYPDIFPSASRYDYRITNSSEKIHYKALDDRTEPSAAEIRDSENLKRLEKDISGFDHVITFGRCADLAAKLLSASEACRNIKFLYSQHLSFMSLNSTIKTDINGAPIEKGSKNSTYKRLEVAAQKIIDQL